jgi:hypothetical protein
MRKKTNRENLVHLLCKISHPAVVCSCFGIVLYAPLLSVAIPYSQNNSEHTAIKLNDCRSKENTNWHNTTQQNTNSERLWGTGQTYANPCSRPLTSQTTLLATRGIQLPHTVLTETQCLALQPHFRATAVVMARLDKTALHKFCNHFIQENKARTWKSMFDNRH